MAPRRSQAVRDTVPELRGIGDAQLQRALTG